MHFSFREEPLMSMDELRKSGIGRLRHCPNVPTPQLLNLWIVPMAILSMAVLAAGCGTSEPAKETAPAPAAAPAAPAAETHIDHDMSTMNMSPAMAPNGARVFFVEPKAGAAVASPLHFVFGSEKITIAAVP